MTYSNRHNLKGKFVVRTVLCTQAKTSDYARQQSKWMPGVQI